MKIEHVALYVNDLENAREFFATWLGGVSGPCYRNKTTGFRSYFVSFGEGARLELMQRPDMDDPGKTPYRTGYAHVAFSLGSREAVDSLTEKLRLAGYEILSGPRITGDGYYESAVLAVEGNQIELTV